MRRLSAIGEGTDDGAALRDEREIGCRSIQCMSSGEERMKAEEGSEEEEEERTLYDLGGDAESGGVERRAALELDRVLVNELLRTV